MLTGPFPFAVVAHFTFILAGLLVYVMGTHASGQRRHPSAALAWVLTIVLLPYVGLPLYLLLGTRKFARPQHAVLARSGSGQNVDSLQACAMATLAGMGLAPPSSHRRVRFHADGQVAWQELEAVILGATTTLDICTYLLGNDALGQRVCRLLQARATEGVHVRLLLDAVGSWRTSSSQLRRLRAQGVQVLWFRPLLYNLFGGRGNLRNHRKLVIADGQRLWSGGRNLAAEYFTGDHGQPPWLDLSFTIDGALAAQALELFNSHWRDSRGPDKRDFDNNTASTLAPDDWPGSEPPQHLIQMVPSGSDQAEDTFYGLLLTALFRAKRRVLAVAPYFVPDDGLLTALCLAARRGVQVELVVPRRSNHRLADIARARALRDLVAAGGKVRLAPAMVHAKIMVVDDSLALCGSLNLDSRSLFLNFELMVTFYASDDIAVVTQWVEDHFRDTPCHRPTQPSLLRDIAEGLVRWLGFQI